MEMFVDLIMPIGYDIKIKRLEDSIKASELYELEYKEFFAEEEALEEAISNTILIIKDHFPEVEVRKIANGIEMKWRTSGVKIMDFLIREFLPKSTIGSVTISDILNERVRGQIAEWATTRPNSPYWGEKIVKENKDA